MKILLANPPYTNFEGMKDSAGNTMPLNLAYLAAYLRDKIKCEIEILDCEMQCMGYKEIEKYLILNTPDIIGITTLTPPMKHVIKMVEIAKKVNPKIFTVLGGIHPTALPAETLAETNADYIIFGEGEITFYELIKGIGENNLRAEEINGLCFKDKSGKIIKNKTREYIKNLNEIPLPARDLFDLSKYYSAPTKKVSDEKKATPILTSRGCAFNCVHCISNLLWNRMVRYRSVENVISEIKECVNKYGIKEFNILDDTFTLDKKRLIEFCEKIIEKKLNICWICFSRVNTIDEEMVEIMKKAGCKKISFGLESGSQKILDLMNKNATLEMAEKAINAVRKHGIEVHASFMIGNIGETKETINDTIKFAKRFDFDNVTFFITAPLPGTRLYEIAKEKGYINKETKWEEFAPLTKTKPILIQENLTEKELIYYQKKAFRKFYLRPKYILYKLKRVRSKEGLKIVLKGILILIRILKRKYK